MSGRVGPELRLELFRGPLGALDGGSAHRAVRALAGDVADDPLPATLYVDGQLALVDDMLHYFDRMSMAHSLEVRVPFLDHEVVEHCATIPPLLKVDRRLRTKAVLKHAARGLVPDRIIHKRKLGFLREASNGWLRAQLSGAASDYLLGPSPRYAEMLDRAAVESLVHEHRSSDREGQTGHVHLLLSILMLEVWLQTYVPRALSSGAGEAPQVVRSGA